MSGPTHETRDIPARVPFYTGVFSIVLVALSAVIAWLVLSTLWSSPVAPSPFQAGAPHLPGTEVAPLKELDVEARQEQWLHGFGWIDREANVVHIPIGRAMDLVVERSATADGDSGQQ